MKPSALAARTPTVGGLACAFGALLALPAAFAATPADAWLPALEAEARDAALDPRNLFDAPTTLPPGLPPAAFEARLRQDWPGLHAEYAALDLPARQAVYEYYRRDPAVGAVRAALLARSRP